MVACSDQTPALSCSLGTCHASFSWYCAHMHHPAHCAGRHPGRWPRCCRRYCGGSTARTASTCTAPASQSCSWCSRRCSRTTAWRLSTSALCQLKADCHVHRDREQLALTSHIHLLWLRRLAAANYDLRAWRTSQEKKGGRNWAEGFAIMDLDDGAAWDFACSVRRAPPNSGQDLLKHTCGHCSA